MWLSATAIIVHGTDNVAKTPWLNFVGDREGLAIYVILFHPPTQ